MQGGDGLSAATKAYIATVFLGAIVLATAYALNPGVGWPHPSAGTVEVLVALALFSTIAFLAELYPIRLPSTRIFDNNGDRVAVSTTVYIAGLLLYGPAFTILVAATSVFTVEVWKRKSLPKVLFNVGQYVLTVGISGLFLLLVGPNPHSADPLVGSVQGIFSLLATIVVYFLLNTSLVSGILALVTGASLREIWVQNNREILPQYAGMLNVGVMAAVLWATNPLLVVLLLLPLLVLQYAVRLVAQLKNETLNALIGIAEMVDARDSYAYRHSMDVARISNQIATRLSLPLEQIELINLAGTLHDIGKIGTPDSVLHKPSKLDDDERTVMELHPTEGAKVLQYFSLFRPGSDLVRYHQEHYDGSGYPSGLAGAQIPLGARIIHVADAYQAMTSDRVYRKALPVEEAMRRLAADSGKQFDPQVVDALFQVLADQRIATAAQPADAKLSPQHTGMTNNDDMGTRGPERMAPGHHHPSASEGPAPSALQTL